MGSLQGIAPRRWALVATLLLPRAAFAQPCIASGPTLVTSIDPQPGWSDPTHHAQVAGIDYFQAEPRATGAELYRSDGTAAGTRLVADLAPGPDGSDPRAMTAGATRLYFLADAPSPQTLWTSDGTAAGTVALTTVEDDRLPRAIDGDTLWFTQSDGLWTSDGTPAGTRLAVPLTECEDVAVLNGRILLRVRQAATGAEIWTSDGTPAGTSLLVDLTPGAESGLGPGRFAIAGGVAYFAGMTDGSDAEPWLTDGTVAGTRIVKDVEPGRRGSFPSLMTPFGARVAFVVVAAGVSRAFVTDGTDAGTVQLDAAASDPTRFTDAGSGRLFFEAARSDGMVWLFGSDGTTAGTSAIRPLAQAFGPPPVMTGVGSAGGLFYFEVQDDGTLWRSDGTPAGTFAVHGGGLSVADGFQGRSLVFPIDPGMGRVGATLLFGGFDPATSMELWSSDGTLAGTQLVADIDAAEYGGGGSWLTPVGPTLYFAASTRAEGLELWSSDLTDASTRLLEDLVPGPASSSPRLLRAAGDRLYFFANAPTSPALFMTDTTTNVTTMLGGFSGASGDPTDPVALGRSLVFVARDGAAGEVPWVSDGTPAGTQLLADLVPGADDSRPRGLTRAGDRVVFVADAPSPGRLWVTDGTAAGTRLVDADDTPAEGLASGDGVAWFHRAPPSGGVELWRTDGVTAESVAQLCPNARNGQGGMAWTGEWLLVARNDAVVGLEPWAFDALRGSLTLLDDIAPGSTSSAPFDLLGADGRAWFLVRDLRTQQLWTSDGSSGAQLVAASADDEIIRALTWGRGTLFEVTGDPAVPGPPSLATASGTTEISALSVAVSSSDDTYGRWVVAMNGTFVLSARDGSGRGGLWTLTPDGDCDGVADDRDTCPAVADPAQSDTDGDGIGDACEPADADGDGVIARDDCDDADASVRRPAGEVLGLRVTRTATGGDVTWDGQEAASGDAVRYDVIGGALPPWDRSDLLADGACLAPDVAGPAWALDLPGSWWVMVRAGLGGAGACGDATTSRPALDALACP